MSIIVTASRRRRSPGKGAFLALFRESGRDVFWSLAETADGVPRADARKRHPAARFVARLFKDDMIAYHKEGWPRIGRVAGLSTNNNKLRIAPHFLDGSGEYVSINVLGAAGLRKLRVAPDGRVRGL